MPSTSRRRFTAWLAAAILAATPLVTVATAAPAAATTSYVVDTVSDNGALSACTDAPGDCSLRGAVTAANAGAGADTIDFDIPAASCPGGVCRLTLTNGPITITDPVDLDATTQPQNGAPRANVCATATEASYMRIEIVSAPTSGSATIFNVSNATGATTIRGFALGSNDSTFFTPGIFLDEGSGHQISCNHFALDGPGINHLGSGDFTAAIELEQNSSHVTIGTNGDGVDDLAERNVFGATGAFAVYINGDQNSTDHRVSGNYFGFTADGSTVLGGGRVYMRQLATGNLIGSDLNGISDDLERNYFGGDKGVGLDGTTFALVDNSVVGNVFGSSPTGTAAPMTIGVEVSLKTGSSDIEIKDNYIGSATEGIYVTGDPSVMGFTIDHNVFGSDPAGNSRPNGEGIRLYTVRATLVSNNLIAESTTTGLAMSDDVTLGTGSSGNCIVANNAGVANFSTTSVTFENNWWWDASGPSGAGSGSGDSVSNYVDYTPWLTSEPAGCGVAVNAVDADFTIAEDVAVGTTVGTVPASGSGILEYSITGGNTGNAFAIDPATGAISTATALDYETTPAYTLTVGVDNGATSDTATVTIDVTDVYETPTTPTFDDVPATNTFFADIEWLAHEGITKGCNPPDNDLFCPKNSVTRGQMAAFLRRALEGTIMQGPPVAFTDVSGSVFADDIQWLGNTGITKGCNPPTNDMFCPNEVVTRGQMAAFLVRALGYSDAGEGNLFGDDDGSVFESAIDKLATAGVTKGCNPPTNDMFCPNDPVTRGQMAAFLHRALGD